MITIKDVAKRAEVSVSTVSYVMNGDKRISEETKKKVMDAAVELGYSGSAGKKNISAGKGKNIIMHVHTIHGNIISEIIYSVQATLTGNGYKMFIQINDHIDYQPWADGYIILNTKISDSSISRIAEKSPVILLDRILKVPAVKNVVLDNFDAMQKITEKAIEKGCRSFYFIAGAPGYDSDSRYEGYAAALKKHNLNISKMRFIKGDYTFTFGKNAAKYLTQTELPDAFICANDEMAVGVIHALRKIETTKQIVVTGFDGAYQEISTISYNFPKYSFMSAKVNREYVGSFAAFSIMEMIENKENFQKHQIITIPCKIIETV